MINFFLIKTNVSVLHWNLSFLQVKQIDAFARISQGWLYVWTACPQPHYSIWLLFVKDNYQTTKMFKQSYYTCLIVCCNTFSFLKFSSDFFFFFVPYGLFAFVRFFFYFTFLELYDPPEASLIATGDGGHICEFRGEWSFTVLYKFF